MLENLYNEFVCMFISMSFYIMLGLLFVGILHTYINKDKVLKHLGKNKASSVINASIVGVPLPLCSCGVVPTALELKKDGASNGAVTSFLISTPQTGVDSIMASYAMMGPFMAIIRPIAAFISGIIGGLIVNVFARDEVIESNKKTCCCSHKQPVETTCCSNNQSTQSSCCGSKTTSSKKIVQVFKYAYGEFLDDISVHFLVGIALASLIAVFIPADLFINLGLSEGILGMLSMVIIGMPMYICSTSSIPIAMSLMTKGLSLGSAFVFLFVGPVTNIASLLVLSKSLGKKITTMYISIVIGCSVFFGLIIDWFVKQNEVILENTLTHSSHGHGGILTEIIAIIFALLLARSIFLKLINKIKQQPKSCCH